MSGEENKIEGMDQANDPQTDITKDAISVEDLVARYEGEIDQLKRENRSLTGKVNYLKGRVADLEKGKSVGGSKFMNHG